jgi:2-polyprenyl-3-methyl-5-hydroxy-6-metoxy-1,4-benzoquinol methylase
VCYADESGKKDGFMIISQCPVCAGSHLYSFLYRHDVPVHQNLVVANRNDAISFPRGELDLVTCEDCEFVFNRAFDFRKLAYGEDYDNTQSCSAYFNSYMDDLARKLVIEKGVRDCTVVEVGCGKGLFLRKLVGYSGANIRGYGFDPSYVGETSDFDGRLTFERRYYDDSCVDIRADVIVCRHVIEHVIDPLALLRSVRAAMKSSPDARVFFETPCVNWILRNRVVWDFFYEHCSLFTPASLSRAFDAAGFTVAAVEHIFGGQYLWIEAKLGATDTPKRLPPAESTLAYAKSYQAHEVQLLEDWYALMKKLAPRGKVALWGAGAKGTTFVNMVDPEAKVIDSLIDINPNKQGRYVPGTGHVIVAPAEVTARGIGSAVLMNPNYRQEIAKFLADAAIDVDLIDWNQA